MPSSRKEADVSKRFEAVVAKLAGEPGVVRGEGKGFGTGTLQVKGKIFAMVTSKGLFVVKLPRERVAELVADLQGEQFDPGQGRLMKEWLTVRASGAPGWEALAREALQFVRAGKATKTARRKR